MPYRNRVLVQRYVPPLVCSSVFVTVLLDEPQSETYRRYFAIHRSLLQLYQRHHKSHHARYF